MSIAHELLSDLDRWRKSKESQYIYLKLEDRDEVPTATPVYPNYAVKRAGVGDITQVFLHGLADRLPGHDIQVVEYPSICTDFGEMIAPAPGEFAIAAVREEEVHWWTISYEQAESLSDLDLACWLEHVRRQVVGEFTRRTP